MEEREREREREREIVIDAAIVSFSPRLNSLYVYVVLELLRFAFTNVYVSGVFRLPEIRQKATQTTTTTTKNKKSKDETV